LEQGRKSRSTAARARPLQDRHFALRPAVIVSSRRQVVGDCDLPLGSGPKRFNELRRLDCITQRMLTATLRGLKRGPRSTAGPGSDPTCSRPLITPATNSGVGRPAAPSVLRLARGVGKSPGTGQEKEIW
jgi:hypothetical protein